MRSKSIRLCWVCWWQCSRISRWRKVSQVSILYWREKTRGHMQLCRRKIAPIMNWWKQRFSKASSWFQNLIGRGLERRERKKERKPILCGISARQGECAWEMVWLEEDGRRHWKTPAAIISWRIFKLCARGNQGSPEWKENWPELWNGRTGVKPRRKAIGRE